MKKFFPYILILFLSIGLFAPIYEASAQFNTSNNPTISGTPANSAAVASGEISTLSWWSLADSVVGDIAIALAVPLLAVFSFITWLSGQLLNFTINYTIIDLNYNLSSLTGINTAWKVIRDLMNIAFIFMLIYEGIMLIIGRGSAQQVKKFIIGIVLASILINFSLFFTKVMIDASNIVTIGFYKSILGDNANAVVLTIPGTATQLQYGLSNPIVKSLGLTTIFEPGAANIFTSTNNFSGAVISAGGSGIILLVTAFIFFAVAILFIVRYVALIILLMLSPIAYMGMALPFMGTYSKQWWNAFKSQLLFAPIYMILTWVTLILMQSSNFLIRDNFTAVFNTASRPPISSMGILLNFAIIIGLLIASLIIAKTTASSGSKLIGQATGKLSGWAGTTVFGGSAWVARKSIGSVGSNMADNADLQKAARDGTGARGAWARTKLYAARTAREATFDARNAQVPTAALGDAIEGTLGRTKYGKMAGMDDLNWSNVGSTAGLSSLGGFGKAGTKGYDAEAKEKAERIRKEKAGDATELSQAEARKNIMAGADSDKDSKKYEDMEKSIIDSSTKQIEAILTSNRELLDSQNFANMISVKQLEAINKSDQFSDEEKARLNGKRFSIINDAKLIESTKYKEAKERVDNNSATQEDNDLIADVDKKVKAAAGRIKGLADSEIELLTAEQLNDSSIVSQFRSAQFESIAKNNQFASSQKKKIKDMRMAPLINSIDPDKKDDAGNSTYITKEKDRMKNITRMITKDLSGKDVAGLFGTTYKVTDPADPTKKVDVSILTHPDVINNLKPALIKRMIPEMQPEDIEKLRTAVDIQIASYKAQVEAGTITPDQVPKQITAIEKWLKKDEAIDFS